MSNHYYTLYVPVEGYVKALEQMIESNYLYLEPSEAEPFQHELEAVIDYNNRTYSAFYPIYGGRKDD